MTSTTCPTTTNGLFSATYDYRTRRLTKAEINSGITNAYRYDGGDCFQELTNGTTALTVEYQRGSGLGGGIGSILYSDRTAAGGPVEHFTYDALGSTMALTDPSGTLTTASEKGSGRFLLG